MASRKRRLEKLTGMMIAYGYMMLFDDDDSSDDDYDVSDALSRPIKIQKIQRCDDFMESQVPAMSEKEFKENFGVSRATYECLTKDLAEFLNANESIGRPSIGIERHVLLMLSVLSTKDTREVMSKRFALAKSTCSRNFLSAVDAVLKLNNARQQKPKQQPQQQQLIAWPTAERAAEVQKAFLKSYGLPGVLGVLGSTHIDMKAPAMQTREYTNSLGHRSIILEAVCDYTGLFTHVYTGGKGGQSCSAVLEESPLFNKLQPVTSGESEYFPSCDSHLITSEAYPVHPHLLTPFIYSQDGTGIQQHEEKYNNTLHSALRIISTTFSSLKQRFKRLEFIEMNRFDKIPDVVLCCCILHNYSLLMGDTVTDWLGGGDKSAPQPGIGVEICESTCVSDTDQIAGWEKRNNIASQLFLDKSVL